MSSSIKPPKVIAPTHHRHSSCSCQPLPLSSCDGSQISSLHLTGCVHLREATLKSAQKSASSTYVPQKPLAGAVSQYVKHNSSIIFSAYSLLLTDKRRRCPPHMLPLIFERDESTEKVHDTHTSAPSVLELPADQSSILHEASSGLVSDYTFDDDVESTLRRLAAKHEATKLRQAIRSKRLLSRHV